MKHVLGERRRCRRVRSVADLVGNTPLVRIRNITRGLPSGVTVYGKLEYFNPGGSVMDRSADQIMRDAIRSGELGHDRVLIDSTSGNTGVAYSMLGAAMGFDVHLVMPSSVSLPRKRIALAFGAKLIDSDPLERSDGAIRMAKKIVELDRSSESPRYFYPDQHANPSNPKAHFRTTAPEIWKATRGQVTHFVAGLGTTGTIMGTGRRLKILNPDIKVVGVQPDDALHGLEGLKHMDSSIVPPIYAADELDELVSVDTDAGREMTERLATEEGLLVGHSAGAAMVAALQVAGSLETGVLVALFPDHADRYME